MKTFDQLTCLAVIFMCGIGFLVSPMTMPSVLAVFVGDLFFIATGYCAFRVFKNKVYNSMNVLDCIAGLMALGMGVVNFFAGFSYPDNVVGILTVIIALTIIYIAAKMLSVVISNERIY